VKITQRTVDTALAQLRSGASVPTMQVVLSGPQCIALLHVLEEQTRVIEQFQAIPELLEPRPEPIAEVEPPANVVSLFPKRVTQPNHPDGGGAA
jgi:hypothetical protein